MTQEEKQLLLVDLCARLSYGVIVYSSGIPHEQKLIGYIPDIEKYSIKPYLRPMSSITDEEFQELHSICPHSTFNKTNVPGWIIGIDGSDYGRISRIDEISKLVDWLNSHHFDYNSLIEKGLALEAPEGMYNIDNN